MSDRIGGENKHPGKREKKKSRGAPVQGRPGQGTKFSSRALNFLGQSTVLSTAGLLADQQNSGRTNNPPLPTSKQQQAGQWPGHYRTTHAGSCVCEQGRIGLFLSLFFFSAVPPHSPLPRPGQRFWLTVSCGIACFVTSQWPGIRWRMAHTERWQK